MNHNAALPASNRRGLGGVVVGLVILVAGIAGLVVRQWLVASAPSRSAVKATHSTEMRTAPDEGDGAIPAGAPVSVFDDEMPAVGKLDPDLLDALRRAATDAEKDGVGLRVNSGWRTPEYQKRLLDDAVAKYGSKDEAARWVATPETSAHVLGQAVDIGPFAAATWLSEHGAAYGLCQVYDNEPWHYELRPDAMVNGCPPKYADPTEDPRMRQ